MLTGPASSSSASVPSGDAGAVYDSLDIRVGKINKVPAPSPRSQTLLASQSVAALWWLLHCPDTAVC